MKKIISLLLAFVIVLSLCFALAACEDFNFGQTGDNGDTTDTTDNNNPSNGGDTPIVTSPDDGKTSDDTDTPITPPEDDEEFEDYGMNVITIEVNNVNITEKGVYNTLEEVAVYINKYHALPQNYYAKNSFSSMKKQYNSNNKISCGGDVFYNREGLLPTETGRTYTECDIGYKGGNRNALRIVFSSDWLVFYTDDHYASFSILRFV